jgi:tRNA(Ile)-lysidine synthase
LTGKTGALGQNVIQFIKEHNLISDGGKVIVGVSGGADSVCLLDILVKHRNELNITLHVAHLNHMLRDKESEEDEQYIRQLSHRFNIPATIERRSATSYQRQKKCSLEEAAREVRYHFFAEVAQRENSNCVTVGHTRDDDVETVLMHLLRGTGMSGLRGLQPLSLMQPGDDTVRIKIIRPLLKTGRNETEEYCKQHRLSIRQDSSNRDTAFLRNRIRLELLPHLRDYNPRIDDALLRMAHSVEENISCIEMLASLKWNELVEQRGSALYLNISKVSELHPALQKQLFRMAIERVAGTLKDIESDHIEQMVQFIIKPSGKTLHQ